MQYGRFLDIVVNEILPGYCFLTYIVLKAPNPWVTGSIPAGGHQLSILFILFRE